VKEVYGLKLEQMIDDEYTTKFLELLKHVPYLKEKKENILGCLNRLPQPFKDRIKFDEPNSLEDAI